MTGRAGRQAQLSASLLVLLLVLMAGCARIPTSGPVGKSSEGSAGNLSAPVFLPAAPQPGASRYTRARWSGFQDTEEACVRYWRATA